MATSRSSRPVEGPATLAISVPPASQPEFEVQELWYLLLRQPWISLAVVSPGRSANTWPLTSCLGDLGMRHGRVVTALNGLELGLARTAALTHLLSPRDGLPYRDDPRFLVAVDSPIDNPLAIGVLAACDAVLLVLELHVTDLLRARRTIELVGRERIIGAVLVGG